MNVRYVEGTRTFSAFLQLLASNLRAWSFIFSDSFVFLI